jgi:hypothetical protein
MRLCKDCIFKSGGECTAQWNIPPSIDPVSGAKRKGTHFQCSTQRGFESNSCGAAGKWWTPTQAAKENIASDKPRQDNWITRHVKYLLGVFTG